jgi:ketopantoate reductase
MNKPFHTNEQISLSNSPWTVDNFSVIDNQDEQQEILTQKKYNFVIIGFWDLWKWWHQLLTEAWQNVYVCSLNWREYTDEYSRQHNIHAYNVFKLPISHDGIDAVLMCCTATDIWLLHDCLPKNLIETKWSKFVFFQNGIWIREKIKQVLFNTPHPTQAVPYFSFKTNGWKKVDIALANPSPITGDQELIITLLDALNQGPQQNNRFEWMDSIILRKEERKKWYVNAFINPLCVIYKLPPWEAVDAFVNEFGPWAPEKVYKELLQFNNEIVWDALAHMEIQEIQQDILNAIEKFRTKYPSTYYQYYRSWTDPIRSDEQSFIWVIMDRCKQKWVSLPLLEELYVRMQDVKQKIMLRKQYKLL